MIRPTQTTRLLLAGVAIGVGLCAPASMTHAQSTPATEPDADLGVYEGRPIREIVLQGLPGPDGTAQALPTDLTQMATNNIRSAVGGAFRVITVREDVARLNRLNVFGSVDSAVQLLDDGSVRLIFSLAEQPVIVAVQVSGNLKMTDQKIYDAIDLVIGAPVDRFQIDRAARKIENLYREKGYYFARVSFDRSELEENGLAVFQIREGERVKITAIQFEGNNSFEPRELRREVETTTSSLFKKGQIDDNELDTDVGKLIQFYRNNGFLDVRAGYRIQPAPNGKEAIIIYLVEEGSLFTLRDVRVEYTDTEPGRQLFDVLQMQGLLEIKRGDVYSVRRVEAAIKRATTAFGIQGYYDAQIVRQELRDPELDGVIVSVTEVRCSPDLRSAKVYVAPLGPGDSPALAKALNRCRGFLRGRLGREIDMKFTPELHFHADNSFDTASHVDALLSRPQVQQDLNSEEDE